MSNNKYAITAKIKFNAIKYNTGCAVSEKYLFVHLTANDCHINNGNVKPEIVESIFELFNFSVKVFLILAKL